MTALEEKATHLYHHNQYKPDISSTQKRLSLKWKQDAMDSNNGCENKGQKKHSSAQRVVLINFNKYK